MSSTNYCYTSNVLPKRRLHEGNSTAAQRAKKYPPRLQGNTRVPVRTASIIVYRKDDAPLVITPHPVLDEHFVVEGLA